MRLPRESDLAPHTIGLHAKIRKKQTSQHLPAYCKNRPYDASCPYISTNNARVSAHYLIGTNEKARPIVCTRRECATLNAIITIGRLPLLPLFLFTLDPVIAPNARLGGQLTWNLCRTHFQE